MSTETPSNVGLFFDPDAYVEQAGPGVRAATPTGLMGRQVAGHEFLDAYLSHGNWEVLTAVVTSRDRAEPLANLCRTHPSSRARQRRLRIVEERDFLAKPEGLDLFHMRCPPDARFAWARHATSPAAFALSGVTHTLASVAAVHSLCALVEAPFEPFDALICTSQAVVEMVRAVTGSYCDYLKDRFGGDPHLRVRLERIPLGVNTDKFRPPTPEERAASRSALAIAAGEVMVLCVGRLSHHAKAHPYPVFFAADQAARRTGQKVHLVFAGWAAHPVVAEQYAAAARFFAPGVRVSFLDGQNPGVRASVWQAADVFISLPDNIQETFGLVVAEAMASGLPVVASDWDGYRDIVNHEETGLLVPTRMMRGATEGSTQRHLLGGVNYDHFLAECSQTIVVDPRAAADALTRFVNDAALRTRAGALGRKRALACFDWKHAIRSYEQLWAEQRRDLAKYRATAPAARGPVRYPPIERSFAGYPSSWLDDDSGVRTAEGAASRLSALLAIPLTNFEAERRCVDATQLAKVLRTAANSSTLGELATMLASEGLDSSAARTTLAWLLKYGLLTSN